MQAPERTKLVGRVTSLSIAVPAHNEGESIPAIVEGGSNNLSCLEQLADYESVVRDDGSKDDTGCILEELSVRHRHVKPLQFAVTQGDAAL